MELVTQTQNVGITGANMSCMNRRDRVMELVSATVMVINSAYRELKESFQAAINCLHTNQLGYDRFKTHSLPARRVGG